MELDGQGGTSSSDEAPSSEDSSTSSIHPSQANDFPEEMVEDFVDTSPVADSGRGTTTIPERATGEGEAGGEISPQVLLGTDRSLRRAARGVT